MAEEAVKWAQADLNNNARQVEIGNMAAIEVTRAKSEVATRKQGLIQPKPRISSRKRN